MCVCPGCINLAQHALIDQNVSSDAKFMPFLIRNYFSSRGFFSVFGSSQFLSLVFSPATCQDISISSVVPRMGIEPLQLELVGYEL